MVAQLKSVNEIGMKMVEYNEYFVSTVATDVLVL